MASGNEMIVRDPDVLGGTPVFRGTRVPFQTLLEYLEGGQTLDEFLEDFPTVGARLLYAPLSMPNRSSSVNCESPAGRVCTQKI